MISLIIKETFILKKIIERRNEGFLYNKDKKYFIKSFHEYTPELIKKYSEKYYSGAFKYCFHEYGGEAKDIKDSEVQLVCAPTGDKLTPISVIRQYKDLKSPHAVFVGQHFCVVKMYYKGKSVMFTITEYKIDLHTGIYHEELLWKECYENVKDRIPVEFWKFENILEAGYKKIHIYQCDKPFYCD